MSIYNEIIIKSHNIKLINKDKTPNESSNCRNHSKCQLKGVNCKSLKIIYKALVNTKMKPKHIHDKLLTK